MSKEFSQDESSRPSILSHPGTASIIRQLNDDQAAVLIRSGLTGPEIWDIYQEVGENPSALLSTISDPEFLVKFAQRSADKQTQMNSQATELSPLESSYFSEKDSADLTVKSQVLELGLKLGKWAQDAMTRKNLFSGLRGSEGPAIAQQQQPEYDRVADELEWFFDKEKLATRDEIGQLMEKQS